MREQVGLGGAAEPGNREPAPTPLDLVQAFVNTNDLEGDSDLLANEATASDWLQKTGFAVSRLDKGDLQRLIRLREALRSLAAANNGLPHDSQALTTLNEEVRPSGAEVVFGMTSVELRSRKKDVDAVIAQLLAAVFEAMNNATWSRLKACRRDVCRWVFYDHSRNHSGTWCTMDICGNRVKTSAYWKRRKDTRS